MTRLPTSDEQFGTYDKDDEGPFDPIADDLGTSGYHVVEEEDHG